MNQPREESALEIAATLLLGVAAFAAFGWLVQTCG